MTKDTVLVSWEALTSAAFAPFGYNKQYVRLRVNMAKTTTIDPLVLVAGDFNGWSDKSKMLNLVTSRKVYKKHKCGFLPELLGTNSKMVRQAGRVYRELALLRVIVRLLWLPQHKY